MQKHTKGFTLTELMAVFLIVGVLASIALMQYSHFLERMRAGEAENLIGQAVYSQERYRLKTGHYVTRWTRLDTAPQTVYADKNNDFLSADEETFFTKGGGETAPNNGYSLHFETVGDRWFVVAKRVGNGSYFYTLVRPFDELKLYCLPSENNEADEKMCLDIMALETPDQLPQDPRIPKITSLGLWF